MPPRAERVANVWRDEEEVENKRYQWGYDSGYHGGDLRDHASERWMQGYADGRADKEFEQEGYFEDRV